MSSKSRKPRMEAVFKSENERQIALSTLARYNLNFSEFCRHILCHEKLPPHSIDFPLYKVAVQFYWMQSRILDNLRYLKNQAKLGRIAEVDVQNLEVAIDENRQISQAILKEIWAMHPQQDVLHLLEAELPSNAHS